LETLGPRHWTPPAAPDWEATTWDGQVVSGSGLRGTPYLLLLYLGADCVHCVEQLQAFAKSAPGFAGAGIRIHAISTESTGAASRLSEKLTPTFELLCDPKLAAFRAFRAYDDFEGDPLHATVLVDGAGRIRWLDVSWKPFLDTAFLLGEAKRLLALPAGGFQR
jgi:peroxiredoxin